ncbi:replicative DNA helicase [Rickettsia endosymbiont of Cardiosporidium cionae]|uniref:replicative DNA helicase n=1 Tax=Rickettsia endosymbiont of Cardiosporidium cionae TaxID=2777155 RepID=UPI001E34303C|nr:replicative DNA helicase [Rickettsia endosymbiont of Cardiosporidium cionae]KAF8818929.1 replicative DNA helicase [Rickettsia endosymbiont of Cardiosporidium cionae]
MGSEQFKVNELQRVLPYNLQAEQMLLGAIIIRSDLLYKVSHFLVAEHFFEKIHQKIYTAIQKILQQELLVTDITLQSFLSKDPLYQLVNGSEYLLKLTTSAMLVINPYDYAKIIYDLAIKRSLISVGEEIVNDAYNSTLEDSALDQLAKAENVLYNLASTGTNFKQLQSIDVAVNKALDNITKAMSDSKHISGISTGFAVLDAILSGFHDSDLIVLAGRPGMGKTSFALNLALNACKELVQDTQDTQDSALPSVVFFSLEMSLIQIATKILSISTQINSDNLRNGKINESDFNILTKSSVGIRDTPFFIDDTGSLSINSLRAKVKKFKRQYNLRFLVIDYLQLMQSNTSYNSRVLEISDITQGLKAIAKDLSIPIIVLSQLSRSVEQRQDKRPMLSDLRDSGAIEQDADVVLFIYRECYYNKNISEPNCSTEDHEKWLDKMEKYHNTAEIIIAKHRNGAVGSVNLLYQPEFSTFYNYKDSKKI